MACAADRVGFGLLEFQGQCRSAVDNLDVEASAICML